MLRRFGTYLGGLLTGLLVAGVLWLLIARPRGEPIRLLPPPTPGLLRVHVAGAVLNPGVYELERGSVVLDAVERAGGASAGAALDSINLAAPLEDGQQVYLPFPTPTSVASSEAPNPTPASGAINVNSATAPELDQLPGIGPSLAQAIVEYRTAHGPFERVEDLLNVPGIGPAKLEAIRDLVTVR
jgi:competence protein ComEA